MFNLKMKYMLLIPDYQEVAGDMEAKYADGLVINATRINDRRKAKIGNDGTYIAKLAGPSNIGYKPMIKDTFVARNGRNATEITTAHGKNVQDSFNKWNNNLDLAFAEIGGIKAKKFTENVVNKKGNWSEETGKKLLRMTGDKIRGRGVSAINAALLVGYNLAMDWFRAGDIWQGGAPYNIARTGLEGSLKMGINQQATKAGLTIVQSGFDAATITRQNTNLMNFLNGMRDPARCDGFALTTGTEDTYCLFALDGALFQLKVQIGLTTT
ncbi:MAG: hypothetical protein HY762_05515 [Planctomycetes bacterium]|nr:hypothetical protein [Planctomycetota bacterium]